MTAAELRAIAHTLTTLVDEHQRRMDSDCDDRAVAFAAALVDHAASYLTIVERLEEPL
jgi:hypothetical protein